MINTQDYEKTKRLASLYGEKAEILTQHQKVFERLAEIEQEIGGVYCQLPNRKNYAKTGFIKNAVVELLRLHPAGIRQKDIATKVQRDQTQISHILRHNPKLFKKTESGMWKLMPEAQILDAQNLESISENMVSIGLIEESP